MKYIASVSFGKDSLAMIILLIDLHMPLDEVVFFDTGMEFDQIYKMRDLCIERLLKPNGIKYTELKPKRPFIDTMINYPHKDRHGNLKNGYGWCGGLCRWGTTEKLRALDNYDKNAMWYIGIAYDEETRFKRLNPFHKIAPLHDFGITEKVALKICYKYGFDFGGLYNHLKRVSCWCCRNKNMEELKAYKKYFPEYYARLIELEKLIGEPMKKPKFLIERLGE